MINIYAIKDTVNEITKIFEDIFSDNDIPQYVKDRYIGRVLEAKNKLDK